MGFLHFSEIDINDVDPSQYEIISIIVFTDLLLCVLLIVGYIFLLVINGSPNILVFG